MHGNRRAHLVQSIREKKLQSLRDPPMDEPAPRRSDRRVGDLAKAIVAEIPALVGLSADDVAAPELVEGAHKRIFFEVASLGEKVEPEVAADGRGNLRGRPRGVREKRQARCDDGLHFRQHALAWRVRLRGRLHPSSFDDEQRMSFAFVKGPRQRRIVELMSGHLACELRRGHLVERAQRDRRHEAIALEMSEQPTQGGVVLLLLGACGADDQTVHVVGRAHEVLQPVQGVAVRPLQVVDDENQRSSQSECLREGLEEAQVLPALQLRGGWRDLGPLREYCRMKPGDISQPCWIQFRQCGPQRRAFQPADDGCICQASFARIASRRGRVDAVQT